VIVHASCFLSRYPSDNPTIAAAAKWEMLAETHAGELFRSVEMKKTTKQKEHGIHVDTKTWASQKG